MARFARSLLMMMFVLGFVAGPTLHLAQPAQYREAAAIADMPCAQMMADDMGQHAPMVPCKGMTPDCIKQMGCVSDLAVPTRLASLGTALTYEEVRYWSAFAALTGVARQPEPQPPRTI